jgi:hypothetical protein
MLYSNYNKNSESAKNQPTYASLQRSARAQPAVVLRATAGCWLWWTTETKTHDISHVTPVNTECTHILKYIFVST